MTTVASALRDAAKRLRPIGSDAPESEARLLLQRVLDKPRVWLYKNPHAAVAPDVETRFESLVERRIAREPLGYVLGDSEFYGRSFAVDARALVPRPETEELCERALAFADWRRSIGKDPRIVIDVGTGTGVLAVSLACALVGAQVFAVDRSDDALAVADINRQRHHVETRVHLIQSDLLAAVEGPADLIVANLPYIPTDEIPALQAEVRQEPRRALDGGADGLELYRHLFPQAAACLHPLGALLVEIGFDQGQRALALAQRSFPDRSVSLQVDLAGHDRVIAVLPNQAQPNPKTLSRGG